MSSVNTTINNECSMLFTRQPAMNASDWMPGNMSTSWQWMSKSNAWLAIHVMHCMNPDSCNSIHASGVHSSVSWWSAIHVIHFMYSDSWIPIHEPGRGYGLTLLLIKNRYPWQNFALNIGYSFMKEVKVSWKLYLDFMKVDEISWKYVKVYGIHSSYDLKMNLMY